MTRGYPDYGIDEEFGKLLMPTDIAELAARLGSIHTWDRRGDIVAYDDFEEPVLKWTDGFSSPLCYAALDTTNALSGSQSMLLHTRGNLNDYSAVLKAYNVLKSRRIGIEWAFGNLAGNRYLQLVIQRYDGVRHKEGGLRYNPSTEKISLMNTGGTYDEIIDTGPIAIHYFMFVKAKLVVDFNTGKYVRLCFTNSEHDLSSYGLHDTGSPLGEMMYFNARLHNLVATEGNVWLDDFIVTQREP